MAGGEAGYDLVTDFHKIAHYNRHVLNSKPLFIGVAGGTASGKSSVCSKIMQHLNRHQNTSDDCPNNSVIVINQDSFYRNLVNDAERSLAERGEFNFDHPDAFDSNLMLQMMLDLKSGQNVTIPIYNYKTNSRNEDGRVVSPADVILIEGILVFYDKRIRDLFSMKLFVDTDPDTRLSRRVLRDINERGRELEQILHQYISLVKPAFEEFCMPTKKYADVIIPRGADNTVAIDLIVQHILDITRSPVASKRARHSSESFIGRPH